MATEKTKFSVIVTPEMLEDIDELRYKERLRSRSAAAVMLLKEALAARKGAGAVPFQTMEAKTLTQLYEKCDERGKENVMETAKREAERHTAFGSPHSVSANSNG